jgi:hypothetical protein
MCGQTTMLAAHQQLDDLHFGRISQYAAKNDKLSQLYYCHAMFDASSHSTNRSLDAPT